MWTRAMLKDEAKSFLRNHYWKAFIVCLIVLIVGGGSGSGSSPKVDTEAPNYNPRIEERIWDRDVVISSDNRMFRSVFNMFGRSNPLLVVATSTLAFFTLIFVILGITIGYALEVGQSRFFLRGFKGHVTIINLFSTFNREEYFQIVKTMFVRDVYTVLWTFLFIIPGIIKSYEYSMVPYIISEYPHLSSSEAIRMSREMTSGQKWDMFVLDLSFIGWELLASLLFGIGFIFLQPYKEATKSKLYTVLSPDEFDDSVVIE